MDQSDVGSPLVAASSCAQARMARFFFQRQLQLGARLGAHVGRAHVSCPPGAENGGFHDPGWRLWQ
eukprot:4114847-Pyramimonas_sp.AAC.1